VRATCHLATAVRATWLVGLAREEVSQPPRRWPGGAHRISCINPPGRVVADGTGQKGIRGEAREQAAGLSRQPTPLAQQLGGAPRCQEEPLSTDTFDPCVVRIRVRRFDAPAAVSAFGTEPAEAHAGLDDRTRALVFRDVAPDLPLAELTARRVVFDGEHSAGLTYPGRLFASQHGEFKAVDRPYSVVSVPIDLDTLTVDPDALGALRAYRDLADRVRLVLGRPQPLEIAVSALGLREIGDHRPWHRLLGTLRIAGVAFHVDAIAVERSARHGQRAMAADQQTAFATAAAGLGTEDGFSEIRLPGSDGRDHHYVLFIYPYDR
jgi:hypothetical protein